MSAWADKEKSGRHTRKHASTHRNRNTQTGTQTGTQHTTHLALKMQTAIESTSTTDRPVKYEWTNATHMLLAKSISGSTDGRAENGGGGERGGGEGKGKREGLVPSAVETNWGRATQERTHRHVCR